VADAEFFEAMQNEALLRVGRLHSIATFRTFGCFPKPPSPPAIDRSQRMAVVSNLQRNLRENITAVMAGLHTRAQLNGLVSACHALALAFLRSKRSVGLLADAEGLKLPDVAYDCIADLFQKSESGDFVRIRAYFGSLDIDRVTDEELLTYLRRLVFSLVNQGVFRLYHEVDPSLGKVLRNVKLSVNALRNFEEVERFGEPCLVPAMAERGDHLPMLDREAVEHVFHQIGHGNERVPELLAKLSLYLRGQSDHSRVVSLVAVALGIRSLYARASAAGHAAVSPDHALQEQDATTIVRGACADVKSRMRKRYVEQKKISADMFEKYFEAIEMYLRARFDGLADGDLSLSACLERVDRSVTREEYRQKHRARIEYLARKTTSRVREGLKKEGARETSGR